MAWFAVPFIITLIVSTTIRFTALSEYAISLKSIRDASTLVGLELREASLVEALSKRPIGEQSISIPDTAIVILLGSVSCSYNQIDLLRYWSDQTDSVNQNPYPVLAVFADPVVGTQQAIRDARLLRHVSRAKFPFLVSDDTLLNPRAIGIRTPQQVLVESNVISRVFDIPSNFE